MRLLQRIVFTELLVALALATGCVAPDTSIRVEPSTAVRGPAFRPVAQVLVERCGSLDCHGSKYRNMHLFGFASSRLEPGTLPEAPDTTQAEADRDYEAVVSLEPELMRDVVLEGGAAPERLTFIRKGRGAEAHKGGQAIVPGDLADRCILSWLASAVDESTCKAAVPRLAQP
jgi:hypothetical protein